MTLRDITIALGAGSPEWPGDTPFSCGWTWAIARGASVNVATITTSPHVGTHADAPLHVRDGAPAAHELPLAPFVGPVVVCGVARTARAARAARAVGAGDAPSLELDDLTGLPAGRVERLLLRTGCSVAHGTFPAAWPALSVGAVRALAARGLQLLGVDAPSVDQRESRALEVHHALFAAGAYDLENLDLEGVADGPYELIAFPVKISGADAAPVRAVLRGG